MSLIVSRSVKNWIKKGREHYFATNGNYLTTILILIFKYRNEAKTMSKA